MPSVSSLPKNQSKHPPLLDTNLSPAAHGYRGRRWNLCSGASKAIFSAWQSFWNNTNKRTEPPLSLPPMTPPSKRRDFRAASIRTPSARESTTENSTHPLGSPAESAAETAYTAASRFLDTASRLAAVLSNPDDCHFSCFYLGRPLASFTPNFATLKPVSKKLEALVAPDTLHQTYRLFSLAPPTTSLLVKKDTQLCLSSEETAALKKIEEEEKKLIEDLSGRLLHLASLQTVNGLIGTQSLSLEEIKKNINSEDPYKSYLSKLPFWRKIIAFLLLYLFINPSIKLVIQGSRSHKGAIENIKNRLATLSQDDKKWRQCVNNLFAFLGDTVFEYADISRRFQQGEAKGQTLAVFREQEREKRIQEHGFDHEQILHGFNAWILETIAVQSGIPLIGPFIDKIINSSLRDLLLKQDFVRQMLSLIETPAHVHHSPIAYELLQSIAYLLSRAREDIQRTYQEGHNEPDVNQEAPETTFTQQEQQAHARTLEQIQNLPFANALSLEDIIAIMARRAAKKDDIDGFLWPYAQEQIMSIAEDGASHLLKLFSDPFKATSMRVSLLRKINDLLTNELSEIEPEAFSEVYNRVSNNAMEVITLALEHEFTEKRVKERRDYPYKYAESLVHAMRQETESTMQSLNRALQEAYQITLEGEQKWLEKAAKAFLLSLDGIKTLYTRCDRITKNAPHSRPFDAAFLDKLKEQMLAQAAYLEETLDKLKELAIAIPLISKKLQVCEKVRYILSLSHSSNPLDPLFAGCTKRTLMTLQSELGPYISPDLSRTIQEQIELIEPEQHIIRQAKKQVQLLFQAHAVAQECCLIIERSSVFGDSQIIDALWARNYDKNRLLQEIQKYQNEKRLVEHPFIECLKKTDSIQNFQHTLYLYLQRLKADREKALLPLPKKIEALKSCLAYCPDIPHSLDSSLGEKQLPMIEKQLFLAIESQQKTITAATDKINTARENLRTYLNQAMSELQDAVGQKERAFERTYTLLATKTEQLQISMAGITSPKLVLPVEFTFESFLVSSHLPDWLSTPSIIRQSKFYEASSLISRAAITQLALPLAERQVGFGRDFVRNPSVLAHIIQRYMVMFFCQNPSKGI